MTRNASLLRPAGCLSRPPSGPGTARRILRPENQGGDVPVPSWLRWADSGRDLRVDCLRTSIHVSERWSS